MKIMALDYGTKRVGIALSDEMRMLARPLPFVSAEPENKLFETIKTLIQEQGVSDIVIGLPKNMDGTLGESAQKAKAFSEKVQASTGLPVKLIDERLTTVQASRQLREAGHKAKDQRSKIDSASAAILLQGYLDSMAF
jgi:putative Holliday junction resolvase